VEPQPHLEVEDAQQLEASGAGSEKPASSTRDAVRSELERMLGSPLFSQSARCRKFLSYVVLETLAGRASQLKERTIGINVFERVHDYNTGDDSIVRVTANDVRKRISQFYGESQAAHLVQIELPRGSYVPEFSLPAKRHGARHQDKTHAQPGNGSLPVRTGSASALEADETQPSASHATLESAAPQIAHAEPARPVPAAPTHIGLLHRRAVRWAAAALLAAAIVTSYWVWKKDVQARQPHLWDAFSRARLPVLICLGEHDVSSTNLQPAAAAQLVADLSIHKFMIPVDDATVIGSLANFLGKNSIPFRIVAADQASLTDLRRQPIILVGGMDNRWTLRLTQGLRYRMTVSYPHGPDGFPVASIVDSGKTFSDGWAVDFSAPVTAWKWDYALIARTDDPTTGVPVLIEAGLGNAGTLAAGELLTSGALTDSLARDARCWKKPSFEAVIETGIVDGRPGPPRILTLECW
jgi:hypothetical protein